MSEILHHYVELITDPAHSLVEFTFVLVDVLIIDAVRRRLTKHFHRDIEREHHRVDAEHGVPVHGDLPLDDREHEATDESVPLSYVEGWLWGVGFEAASRYLQDPAERAKIAEQYRSDILTIDTPAGHRYDYERQGL